MGRIASIILCAAMMVDLAACVPEARLPDIRAIYMRTVAAAGETHQRRPLIGIPGTLGSRLIDTASGALIWGGGASRGISADPENPDEFRLIALPIGEADEPLSALRDSVRPDGVLETAMAEILGVPIDIDVYGPAQRILAAGGFMIDRNPAARGAREEGEGGTLGDFNLYQFDYDWRRDIIESAQAFGRFVESRREVVAKARGVSRYFLMYGDAEPDPNGPLPPITWAGAEYFSRVVFVAPPNAGSIVAMDNLINGKELGPLQPFYPAALLATHPSTYQLMPRARHNRVTVGGNPVRDIYSVDLWDRMGWGLLDPDAAEQLAFLMPEELDPERRRARARRHTERLLRRAELFHILIDRWAPPPEHLDLFLVVGGGFETPAAATVEPTTGDFEITAYEEGDGVVLRASSLLDERQDGNFTEGLRTPLLFKTTLFLPDEHVELTKNPVFGDNLLFWLLEAPRTATDLERPDQSQILGGPPSRRDHGPLPQVLEAGMER